MTLPLFALLLSAVALAWVVALRRRPDHLPVALALSAALFAECGRAILVFRVLPPTPDPAHPLTGWLRGAIYLDRALWLVWPAALAAASLRVLARRRIWPVAIVYVAAVAALCIGYPALRFDTLRRAYLACELVALTTAIGSLVTWFRQSYGQVRSTITVLSAGLLSAGHFVAVVAGPYRFGLFGQVWELALIAYFATLLAVVAFHLGVLIWETPS